MGYALTQQTLVTGANGYLGSQIITMLRNRGVDAAGVGRSESCDIVCDLRDRNATKALIVKHPDSLIIHCAAVVPKSTSDYFDEKAAAESLAMVRNLANSHPRHVVFASTMTVYPEGIFLAREEDADPIGKGYAASKFEAEYTLLECPDITTTILRLPGLFGLPRQEGVLFRSALALARGGVPTLNENLPQWASMHIEDAADICIRAAIAHPICSMVMNAGYPGPMSISASVARLAEIFGSDLSLPIPRWFEFDLSRLNNTLGPVSGKFIERLNDLADWARMSVHNNHNA